MTILYRPHRGGLAESMAEMKVFHTLEEMKASLVDNSMMVWGKPAFEAEDLSLSEILGDDNRVGWKNVQYVLTKRFANEIYEHPQCIGMCSIQE